MKTWIFTLCVFVAAMSARADTNVAPVSLDWELLETEMSGTYNNLFVLSATVIWVLAGAYISICSRARLLRQAIARLCSLKCRPAIIR